MQIGPSVAAPLCPRYKSTKIRDKCQPNCLILHVPERGDSVAQPFSVAVTCPSPSIGSPQPAIGPSLFRQANKTHKHNSG